HRVKRREFLAYGASLASLAAVDSLGLQVQRAVGVFTFSDLRRLSDPVDVPDPVDNVVDYFYAVLKDFSEAANRVSPKDLFGAVAKQTATIDALRRNSGSSAHRLLEVESRYAEQLGWLYQEAGNTDAAVYWCDRAWEFAHHAEDHQMAAYALARKSYLALQGDPDPSLAT